MNWFAYAVESFKKLNIQEFKDCLEKVHMITGKSKPEIFLDMALCAFRHQAGYYDYTIFGMYDMTEEQRKNIQQLEPRNDGVSNTLTSVQKDNYVLIPEATKDGYIPMEFGGVCDLSYPNSDTRRGRVQEGGTVAPTLTCGVENSLRRIEYGYRIRKLTERECFRLMDMPEEYIDRIQAAGISRSQQYKMAGNSIVVACMYHIWRKLFIDTEIKTLTLF
jgi:DNA (cytosine-5)-methyltransferase 1